MASYVVPVFAVCAGVMVIVFLVLMAHRLLSDDE